jgi:hypothetical protein
MWVIFHFLSLPCQGRCHPQMAKRSPRRSGANLKQPEIYSPEPTQNSGEFCFAECIFKALSRKEPFYFCQESILLKSRIIFIHIIHIGVKLKYFRI